MNQEPTLSVGGSGSRILDPVDIEGNLGGETTVDVQLDRIDADVADIQSIDGKGHLNAHGRSRLVDNNLEGAFGEREKGFSLGIGDGQFDEMFAGIALFAAKAEGHSALGNDGGDLLDKDGVESANDAEFTGVFGCKIAEGKDFSFHEKGVCGGFEEGRQLR